MTSQNAIFRVDYAKSSLATCRGCEAKQIVNNKIAKGTLRIATVQQADRFDRLYELWYHLDCLFENETQRPTTLGSIQGIQRIRYADQLLILGKMKSSDDEDIPSKRFKADTVDEVDKSNLAPLISKQNEDYYRIYDAMNAKNRLVPERRKKDLLKEILDLNEQAKPYQRDSTQVFLEHVVDILTFGAIDPCSECFNAGYIFDGTFGYICNHRFYEFGGVKCNNQEKAPKRSVCVIPDKVKNIYPILKEHREPRTRILFNLKMPPENLSATACPNSKAAKAIGNKQILKYGTVVDPLSGLEKEAHVYSADVEYATILSKVMIQENINSFYKIQLLESDDYQKYWVFYNYGRIGDTGTHNLVPFQTLHGALDKFNEMYTDKTGDTFGFEYCDMRLPFKFVKVDIDYGDEIHPAQLLANNKIPSQLPDSVQQLVRLCFDTHIMKDMMIEFELDIEKMPLGKLSKDQIKKAWDILMQIMNALEKGAPEVVFIDLSNRFYTVLPHDCGAERPPVIKDLKLITEKLQVVKNLFDIQLAYSLLSTEGDVTKCPVDNCYEKLKTDIEPLDPSSELFRFLEQYAANTHAPTHNFRLIVEEIFMVKRNDEAARYEPFQNSINRYLLWHGSKIINFVGILSNGLKIAPPQAQRTGDMFGNGIYFSDMVTKSAQYCCVDRNNRHGLLLLCEVALGEMDECLQGFSRSKLSSNKSVKGCGKTYPNPNENVIRDDGVIVPCGKPLIDHRIQSELKYNEYIVYDESKVIIKYLFKVRFERKKRHN